LFGSRVQHQTQESFFASFFAKKEVLPCLALPCLALQPVTKISFDVE
jgi:hypothetical protein